MDAPERLGPYRLLSTLGSGGFGEVHLALDAEGRTVAVKVLHPHIASDAAAIARLVREVEIMRRVRGRHVAEVLDASLAGGRPYIVTRYVQGRPLSAVVAADGPLAGDDLLRLARGLAEALHCVHAAGVVHRDLKPANVILAEGEPYLIDFGIACALESASVTASGAIVGTPGYLAPEVLEGRQAGPASDVFAWAATVAFAATGGQPYGTGPATAIAYRVVHHEPDLSGVPSWLAPLLGECLRGDPAARPSAAQLVARLSAVAPTAEPAVPSSVASSSAAPRFAEAVAGAAETAAEETRTGKIGAGEPGTAPTVELSAARRPRTDPRARHREKVHHRWVIGSAVVVGLFSAAARDYLPEVSLLMLVLYGVGVLIDAGFGLAAKAKARLIVDAVGGAGAVALWALLSSLFSTFTLLLAAGTVLFIIIMIIVSS